MRIWRRTPAGEEGSILLAMLAIIIMTAVIGVGLSTILVGQTSTRHDSAFDQALQGAETGLNKLLATVPAAITNGTTPAPVSLTTGSVTYNASIFSGSPCTNGCVLQSKGTATISGRTVSRTIQQSVNVTQLPTAPLFGDSLLSLGEGPNTAGYGSGVDTYSSAGSSAVCTKTGSASTMSAIDTRMCSSLGAGPAATNGSLTLQSGDVTPTSHFSKVYLDNTAAHGGNNTTQCTAHSVSSVCSNAVVTPSTGKLVYPQFKSTDSICSGGGPSSVPLTSSLISTLSAGGVFDFTDVDLNLQSITGLLNLSSVTATPTVICFNGNLNISSLNGLSLLNLPGLSGLLGGLVPGLGSLLPPINAQSGSLLGPYTPRPPASLVFIDTAPNDGSSHVTFGCDLVSSLVNQCSPNGQSSTLLGLLSSITSTLLSNVETSISSVIYAPQATCSAKGHADIYGELICGSVDAPQGLDVHYDTQLQQTGQTSQQSITVDKWTEISH